MRLFRIPGALILICGLAGCSDLKPQNPLTVHVVQGKLTWKNAPMAGARITFFPRDQTIKLSPSATADEKGVYELTTYYEGDGSPIGDYVVAVYWPATPTKVVESQPDAPLPPDRLKNQYADPKRSRLRAEVHEGNNTIDFNLP